MKTTIKTLLINKVRNYAQPNNCSTIFGLNASISVKLKEKVHSNKFCVSFSSVVFKITFRTYKYFASKDWDADRSRCRSSYKCPLLLSHFQYNSNVSKICSKTPRQKKIFNKNPLSSSRVVTCGQTGGQTHCQAKQEYEYAFASKIGY
jgi:hypothetical protein